MFNLCRITLLLALSSLCASVGRSQERVEISVAESEIINQHLYPDSVNACGPASIMNLLKFGTADYRKAEAGLVGSNEETRFRFLIERYFKGRASVVIKGQKRWGLHGVMTSDLVDGVNELLEANKIPALSASYLDRKEGESDSVFIRRIHKWIEKSLSRGVPPILSLRSYAVRRRKENQLEPSWEMERHHYVVITSVPKSLGDGPTPAAFEATIIDSNDGKQRAISIHLEANGQPFRALKGDEASGNWLKGRPFLIVEAPTIRPLRPADLKWSDRFLVVANFLIGDF